MWTVFVYKSSPFVHEVWPAWNRYFFMLWLAVILLIFFSGQICTCMKVQRFGYNIYRYKNIVKVFDAYLSPLLHFKEFCVYGRLSVVYFKTLYHLLGIILTLTWSIKTLFFIWNPFVDFYFITIDILVFFYY